MISFRRRSMAWVFGFGLLSQFIILSAQEIPKLDDTKIKTIAYFDHASNFFNYSYELENGAKSSGKIWGWDLDISRSTNSVAFSDKKLTIGTGSKFRSFSESKISGTSIEMVPVGMKPPDGWTAGLSINVTASWAVRKKNFLINPGNSQENFEIRSLGPPRIRKAVISPDFILSLDRYATAEDEQKSLDIGKAITVTLLTIGPGAPISLDPMNLIDELFGLYKYSTDLGWSSNELLIERYLQKSKNAVNSKNTFIGRLWLERLNQLLEQEKQKGSKNLTDNGYYLLKPNIDFILNKLPNQPKDASEKREAEKIKNEK